MNPSIRKLDLNLLKVFDILFDTCSVSDTANLLFITQSAASHSLRRLREIFNDPLFVSSKSGMVPTQFANSIVPGIKESLKLVQQTMNFCHAFDPATSTKRFILYCSEYFEVLFLPALAEHFNQHAPNCSIEIRRLSNEIPADELDQGNADLVIGFASYFRVPGNLIQRPFTSDKLVCVVDMDNPNVGESLSLDEYLALEHIYPSPWGNSNNMVESWLQKQGKQRNIKVMTQNYLSAAMSVVRTNYVLTLPSLLVHELQQVLPIRMVKPPEDYPGFQLEILTTRLFENSASNIWLRAQLEEIARRFENLQLM